MIYYYGLIPVIPLVCGSLGYQEKQQLTGYTQALSILSAIVIDDVDAIDAMTSIDSSYFSSFFQEQRTAFNEIPLHPENVRNRIENLLPTTLPEINVCLKITTP